VVPRLINDNYPKTGSCVEQEVGEGAKDQVNQEVRIRVKLGEGRALSVADIGPKEDVLTPLLPSLLPRSSMLPLWFVYASSIPG
jgi:hypothetical protein